MIDPVEPDEPDLIRTTHEVVPPPPVQGPGPWPLVAIVIGLAALLAGGWWWSRRPADVAPVATTTTPAAPDASLAPAAPLGGNPFPADVPSLELSDAFVRTWLPKLSAHPRIAAWLTTDQLVRNFVTVVTNVAEGGSPAGQLGVLKPKAPFQVVERGGRLYLDPRSYERYNDLAAALASLDSAGAAQLYATLKPRIQEASGELGTSGPFDTTLERAIVALLRTPIRDEPLAVEPAGIGYRFADDRLDALTGAQQHLLRMGPANARLVQQHLRDLALALGIPATRLPPPTTR